MKQDGCFELVVSCRICTYLFRKLCDFIILQLKPHRTKTARADPERLLNLARGHWGIENKSHYVRDVTFDEDRSQISKKSGPRVMATLRNFVISILRLIGRKNIAKALRDMAAKPHMALRLIGI